MKTKIIGTTVVALLMVTGAAFSQQSPVQPGNVDSSDDNQVTNAVGNYASDDEKAMYKDNTWMRGFFTDDSMSTMKSDAELKAAFAAMGAEDKAGMKAACDRVDNDRGSYGSVTQTLCQQAMTN